MVIDDVVRLRITNRIISAWLVGALLAFLEETDVSIDQPVHILAIENEALVKLLRNVANFLSVDDVTQSLFQRTTSDVAKPNIFLKVETSVSFCDICRTTLRCATQLLSQHPFFLEGSKARASL